VGKEPAAMHLARVKVGLMSQRLRPWPHRGPMIWREGAGERAQVHVIDGWQHLGSFDGQDDDALRHFRPAAAPFDMDAYRILTRQLKDARLTPFKTMKPSMAIEDESWS
jgi:DNA polymerase-3 subunit epsilon